MESEETRRRGRREEGGGGRSEEGDSVEEAVARVIVSTAKGTTVDARSEVQRALEKTSVPVGLATRREVTLGICRRGGKKEEGDGGRGEGIGVKAGEGGGKVFGSVRRWRVGERAMPKLLAVKAHYVESLRPNFIQRKRTGGGGAGVCTRTERYFNAVPPAP